MSFDLAGQTENSDMHDYSFGGPFDDNEDAGSKPHADLLSGNNTTETGNSMTSDGWTQQSALAVDIYYVTLKKVTTEPPDEIRRE